MQNPTQTSLRPDYGIDAPGAVRNLLVVGSVALLVRVVCGLLPWTEWTHSLARMGVDVVILGGTKAGSTPTEAIVLLNRDLERRFGARLKHGGQLVSKARFLAAPWIGLLESGAWSVRAAHANAMAARLAALSPFRLTHPVEANAVFVEMDEPALKRLQRSGWFVYRFIDGSVRFMCSWATTAEAVDELGAALKAIAED